MSSKKKRRAKKKKNHDPAYMVRESEIKAHIDRLLKNNPSVQQSMREEARRVNLAEAKKQDIDLLTLILMALRRSEKYGHDRLVRVAHEMADLRDYYEDRYDDCDMFAMRMHLKEETGIDIEKLYEEVNKIEDTCEAEA